MASKLTLKEIASTIRIEPGQNAIILQKDIFPANVDAGMIDAFIESNFPNLISRIEGEVNGVSVSKDEIVIALNSSISQNQISQIITRLQNNFN